MYNVDVDVATHFDNAYFTWHAFNSFGNTYITLEQLVILVEVLETFE